MNCAPEIPYRVLSNWHIHAYTHTTESWIAVLQSFWPVHGVIHGTEWYTTCVSHPSLHIFLHGFKLCLWFWLSWFIIHRSTCCVHDWFGNEPLLNRTPCAYTHVARWCNEWCLMPAWCVLHPYACFSTDIIQHMGHRDFECSYVTTTRKTDAVMRSLKQFTKAVAMEAIPKIEYQLQKKRKKEKKVNYHVCWMHQTLTLYIWPGSKYFSSPDF